MSQIKPIRLGLIGSGARLRNVLRRLLNEARPGEIEIVAAYDPDPQALEATAHDCKAKFAVEKSEEALIARADIDWVFIGSWNIFHARQAIAALKAGKNVFCEKPLATTFEDCLAVRDAVQASGRVFAFGLVLRYSPHYQKVRELVHSGQIGRIISFEFNETLRFNHGGYIFGNWRRETANAGTHLLEKCCHDLDLVNWITNSVPIRTASFGGKNFFIPANEHHVARIGPNAEGKPAYSTWADPRRVNPFSEGSDIVDNQVAILEYADGVRATFHTNCNAGIPERRLYICGTEGTLRADAVTGVIELQRIGHDTKIENIETGATDPHAGGDEVMAKGLVETLVRCAAPMASVDDGIRSAVVAFGIDQAMQEQRVVDLSPWWKVSKI